MDVPLLPTIPDTFVQVAQQPLTALKNALKLRKLKALTPYDLEAWQRRLQDTGLI